MYAASSDALSATLADMNGDGNLDLLIGGMQGGATGRWWCDKAHSVNSGEVKRAVGGGLAQNERANRRRCT